MMMTVVCGGNGAIIMITMEKIAVDEALSLSVFSTEYKKNEWHKISSYQIISFFCCVNAPITEENIFQLTFILKELYNQREYKNVHFLKSLMSIMIMELDAFVSMQTK